MKLQHQQHAFKSAFSLGYVQNVRLWLWHTHEDWWKLSVSNILTAHNLLTEPITI